MQYLKSIEHAETGVRMLSDDFDSLCAYLSWDVEAIAMVLPVIGYRLLESQTPFDLKTTVMWAFTLNPKVQVFAKALERST